MQIFLHQQILLESLEQDDSFDRLNSGKGEQEGKEKQETEEGEETDPTPCTDKQS